MHKEENLNNIVCKEVQLMTMNKPVHRDESVSHWLIESSNVIVTLLHGKYTVHPTAVLITLSERERGTSLQQTEQEPTEILVEPTRNRWYHCVCAQANSCKVTFFTKILPKDYLLLIIISKAVLLFLTCCWFPSVFPVSLLYFAPKLCMYIQ